MKPEEQKTFQMPADARSDAERNNSLYSEDEWFSLPAALLFGEGIIRLREPSGTDVSDLLTRLRNGVYSRPFVVDDGTFRYLHFSFATVQSKMRVDEPYALNFAYTRKMMAFLLFVPNPQHVVLVGLGGGSMTKFCYRQLPSARITTVEINDDVIGFGKLFHVPGQDARMRILHADAVEYFATTGESADVILIDGCDKYGVAPAFCHKHFYQALYDRLHPDGVLVMNLIGTTRAVRAHLRHITGVFTGRILVRDVGPGDNQVIFAFKNPAYSPDWSSIQRSAKQLAQQHGLDFPGFARKLRHSSNSAGKTIGFSRSDRLHSYLKEES